MVPALREAQVQWLTGQESAGTDAKQPAKWQVALSPQGVRVGVEAEFLLEDETNFEVRVVEMRQPYGNHIL